MKTYSAHVWIRCLTSRADCSRVKVQLHWRLCIRSWGASDRQDCSSLLSAKFREKGTSVSRAQSSWASVGDKAAFVSQVTGSMPRQHLVDQGGGLELDALPHWKPVQLAENWRDAVLAAAIQLTCDGGVDQSHQLFIVHTSTHRTHTRCCHSPCWVLGTRHVKLQKLLNVLQNSVGRLRWTVEQTQPHRLHACLPVTTPTQKHRPIRHGKH